MEAEYVLEATNIVKTFPGVRALDGVNLKVRKGEIHAVVGENGAGKSTLMLILSGIYNPDEGHIKIDGIPVEFDSPEDAVKKGIGIVFQELSLVPSLSIAENIFANRQPVTSLGFVNRTSLRTKTIELLSLFGLEHLDTNMLVRYLPLAQQQVIEILKALSHNPRILILDEPTSSLTEIEIKELFKNIRILTQRGIACVYISHHLHEIFEIADTVTVLRDGRYVCDAEVKDIDEDFLVSRMVGRPIVDMYGHRDTTIPFGPVRFKAQHISRAGNFADISFSIKGGEIVGFAGLVGAGRTEVGRSIFGAEPIEEGTLWLDNKPIHPKNPRQAIAEGIGYLSEDRKSQGLFLDFSIRANVVANHLFDFCNSNGFLQERKTVSWASKIVSEYRIATPDVERPVKNLSGGNQQKVLAAEWIGINPKLLIVDEPTRGVDVGAKSEIYVLIRKLAATGAGIMLISSDLSEILGLSDRIIVMQNGVIVGELIASEATEEKVIALATGAKQGVYAL